MLSMLLRLSSHLVYIAVVHGGSGSVRCSVLDTREYGKNGTEEARGRREAVAKGSELGVDVEGGGLRCAAVLECR
jgi:hypothetical protein